VPPMSRTREPSIDINDHTLRPVREAAAHVRLNPEVLKRMAREGRVPFYKVGREIKFDLVELREHFRAAATPTNGTKHATAHPDFSKVPTKRGHKARSS